MDGTTNWRNVRIISLVTFVDSLQFSFYMWSFWPYVQQIDSSIDTTFVGIIMAISGVGEALAAPVFGFWANKIGRILPPVYTSLVMSLVGNILYLFLGSFSHPSTPFAIIVSRFLSGASSGNRGCFRALVAHNSQGADRAKALASSGGAALIGLTIGPAVQLMFNGMGTLTIGPLVVSQFTAPAVLAVVINMKLLLLRSDIFDVNADAFALPADSDLSFDGNVFERADILFKKRYEARIEKIQSILPLTEHAVFRIDTGMKFICQGLFLVFPGPLSDVPTRSELISVRQAYKELMERVLREEYDSIVISLPSVNSPDIISEILHSIVNRCSKKTSFGEVTLLSDSNNVLETTRSLLGGFDSKELSSPKECNEFLKTLKIASPDVHHMAQKKVYKMSYSKEPADQPAQCYFAKTRICRHEKHPREVYAAVSTNCDGEMTRMSDLQKIPVSDSLAKLGVFNELEVVLARGAGIFERGSAVFARQWTDRYVCDKHLDELSRKWGEVYYHHTNRASTPQGRKLACGFPDHDHDVILGTHRMRDDHKLTKNMAFNYLVKSKKLLPVGLPICTDHSALDSTMIPEEGENVKEERKQKDPDWMGDDDGSGRLPAVSPELISLFNQIVEKAGIRGATPSSNFGALAMDTKLRRVYALKKLNDIMMSIMAPGAESELREMFINSFSPRPKTDTSTTKLKKVLNEVSEQYEKTTNRRSKELILSTIADVVPYRELQEYIPDVSIRKYYNAKKRAIRLVELIESKYQKSRYEPVRISLFIAFITSPYVSIGLPYGERHVKKSDGSKETIPNTLRLFRNEEIWRMYTAHMAQTNQSHLMIKRSVAHAILKKCAATRRHAMTCVDYFVAEGLDAFEDLDDILDTLVKNALLDVDMHKELKQSLLRSKTYLRTDYKMHIKKESKVADHCMFHALSDPNSKEFKYEGEAHEHELKCPRCKEMDTIFERIKTAIYDVCGTLDKKHGMKKEVAEMKIRWTQDVERIYEMKKHFLRSVYTDLQREEIISSLGEGEGLLTLDFAQKHLPMYKWESQKKYFGKRGMSYHISHVLVKRHGHFIQHSLVHVLNQTKQDNVAVVQMMDHVCGQLSKMGVSAVHVRADNAGAYHSLGTIASIPQLAKKNKVAVKSFSFSEAQNGKSSCDRVAAQVKRRVRDYIAARNTIANEAQFFKAIAQSGLQGLSVYLATITRGTEKQEKTTVKNLSPQMPGITQLGHFEFEQGNARAWKFAGIGHGVQFKNLSGFPNQIKIEKEGGILVTPDLRKAEEELLKKNESPKSLWLAYLKKEKKEKDEEPDDGPTVNEEGEEIILPASAEATGLFECKKCGACYIRYSNLVRHVETESHFKRPEKMNLYDCALKMYKEGLEGVVQEHKVLDQVNAALTDIASGDGSDSLEEGWALRGQRKTARYSDAAKKFVKKVFKKGAESGRKMDPAEAERLMKEDESIKPYQRMNAQQIRSYFSKLSREGKIGAFTAKKQKRDVPDYDMEDDDDLYDEDVENIDCFGRQVDDVIDDIIFEEMGELFDGTVLHDDLSSDAICVYFMLEDSLHITYDPHGNSAQRIAESEDSSSDNSCPLPSLLPLRMDVIAVIICMGTRSIRMLATSNIESIGAPFTEIMFNFTHTQALEWNTYDQFIVGAFTIIVFLIYAFTSYTKWVSERSNCMIAIVGLFIFYCLTMPWPFLPGDVDCTRFIGNDTHNWDWCEFLPPVNQWLYYSAYAIIYGICLPMLNNSLQALYSRVLGDGPQGTMQGVNQAVGSIARILGPLVMSSTFSHFGPQATWSINIALLAVVIGVWIVAYRRLVPLELRKDGDLSDKRKGCIPSCSTIKFSKSTV